MTVRRALLGTLVACAALVAVPAAAEETARPEVGDPAPAFTLPGLDGQEHSLSELAGEKNLVLVFFRGAW